MFIYILYDVNLECVSSQCIVSSSCSYTAGIHFLKECDFVG